MTWTYNKDGVIAVVSAENCETARVLLSRKGLFASNVDLIPVVTSTRWLRVLSTRQEHD